MLMQILCNIAMNFVGFRSVECSLSHRNSFKQQWESISWPWAAETPDWTRDNHYCCCHNKKLGKKWIVENIYYGVAVGVISDWFFKRPKISAIDITNVIDEWCILSWYIEWNCTTHCFANKLWGNVTLNYIELMRQLKI